MLLNFFEALFILLHIKRWKIGDDKGLFVKRLGFKEIHSLELDKAINKYLNQSLKNVFYYRRKLLRENLMRRAYALFTLLIVTAVPYFVFQFTDNAVGGIFDGSTSGKTEQTDGSGSGDSENENQTSSPQTPQMKQGSNVDKVVYFQKELNARGTFVHTAALQDTGMWMGDEGDIEPATTPEPVRPTPRTSTNTGAIKPKIEPEKVDATSQIAGQNNPTSNPTPSEDGANDDQEPEKISKGEEKESSADRLQGLEAVGIILSLLLTSLFAVHHVVSQWASKRKFRAHFHQAKMDLMEIHYALEENSKSDFDIGPERFNEAGLIAALTAAAKECRAIVNAETKTYFEMSAEPTVQIGTIFSSSMNTANSLIGAFSSKRYTREVEQLRREVKNTSEKAFTAKDSLEDKIVALKSAYRSLASLDKRTLLVDEKLDALEDIGLEQLSEEEQDNYEKLKVKFDAFDDERDKILDSIQRYQSEIDALEIALREYQN